MDHTETTKTTCRDDRGCSSEQTTVRTFVENRENGENAAFREMKEKIAARDAEAKEAAGQQIGKMAQGDAMAYTNTSNAAPKPSSLRDRVENELVQADRAAQRRVMLKELQHHLDCGTQSGRFLDLINQFYCGPR